jgi:hypothetical protein
VLTKENKMNKRLFVYIACALGLSGCAHLKWVPSLEERSLPQVTVKDGRIVVTPEILFYFKDEREVDIVFQLPRGGGFTFPTDNGLVIEGELLDQVIRGERTSVVLDRNQKEIACKWRSEVEFVCRNMHTRPGVYKYTIRVIDKDKRTVQRDPPMVNW